MTILEVKDLSVSYNFYEVLNGINFKVEKGDYIGIVGPNGAGKTTLIKALLGLIPINTGTIKFQTEKIGYLQQKVSLNDSKFPSSVEEIIRSGLLVNKKVPRIYTGKDKEKTEKIMETIGIKKLKNKQVGKISGGELQKVLLSRALISEPEILFLDEPTTALDPQSRENFYNFLKELNEKNNLTVILVSHDIGSIGKYAKKIMYIDRKLVFYGNFDEFCKSKDMTKYFGNISQHFFCHKHD